MRILAPTLITSLLLNGLAVTVESRAADEASQVCNTVGFTAEVPANRAEEKCAIGIDDHKRACLDTRMAVAKWSEDYKKLAKEACEKHQKALGEINQLSQKSSFDEVKSKASAGIADIDTLIAANKKILDEMPKLTQANINALKQFSLESAATPVYKKRMNEVGSGFTQAYQKHEKFKTDIVKSTDNSGISGIKATSSKAHLEALGQSQLFIRSLVMDKEKNEAAKQKLTEARDDAEKKSKGTRTTEGGKKEDGFNPMSLMPLAGPLASMLMQKKQQSGVTDQAAQSTNPYATTPQALGGTSLEPKSGDQASGAKFESSRTPSPEVELPTEKYAGSSNGILEPFGGDITNKNGEGKANTPGGAGGYSANSGGFSADSSGASATPGKSDRKPASAGPAPAEEGLINSAGGGAGYSAPSSTDPSSAEADGGMKDMLHDMESTLEDVPTGLFAEADLQASADGVAPENSESLFPRVRACHVRNLKKGFVLNGLGEKLPESESH